MINRWLNSLAITGGLIASAETTDFFESNLAKMCYNCLDCNEADSVSPHSNKEASSSGQSDAAVRLPDIILSHVTTSAVRIIDASEKTFRSPRRSRRRGSTTKKTSKIPNDGVDVSVNPLPSSGFIDKSYECCSRGCQNLLTNSAIRCCSECCSFEIQTFVCRSHKCQMQEVGLILKFIGDKFQENYPKTFQKSDIKNLLSESRTVGRALVACCLVGLIVAKIKKAQWL